MSSAVPPTKLTARARATLESIQSSDIPEIQRDLSKLLAGDCKPRVYSTRLRRLTPDEQRAVLPAVPALATAIFFYRLHSRLEALGIKPGAAPRERPRVARKVVDPHTMTPRRKRVQLAVGRMERLLVALDDILVADQLTLCAGADGANLGALERRLQLVRDRCISRMSEKMRGAAPANPYLAVDEFVERVGEILRGVGVPTRRGRRGLGPAVLARAFLLAGIAVPKDFKADLPRLADDTGWDTR